MTAATKRAGVHVKVSHHFGAQELLYNRNLSTKSVLFSSSLKKNENARLESSGQ